jgi:hypothetical protein
VYINLQSFSKKASLLFVTVVAFGLISGAKPVKNTKSTQRFFAANADTKKVVLKN